MPCSPTSPSPKAQLEEPAIVTSPFPSALEGGGLAFNRRIIWRPTTIQKQKWDGSVSARWPAQVTGEGRKLVWRTPAGTRRERPRKREVETTGEHEISASLGLGWIATAYLAEDGRLIKYRVDATAGQEEEVDGIIVFIDLDIDLLIDGGVTLADVPDFVQRASGMGYPPGILRQVIAALEDAARRVAGSEWPFDGSLLAAWLDRDR